MSVWDPPPPSLAVDHDTKCIPAADGLFSNSSQDLAEESNTAGQTYKHRWKSGPGCGRGRGRVGRDIEWRSSAKMQRALSAVSRGGGGQGRSDDWGGGVGRGRR